MSVDAASERAALEAKDRDELQQIIGALGGKVTSRTRKAQMIDQILELTGVVTAPPAKAEAPAAETPAEAGAAPQSGGSGDEDDKVNPRGRGNSGRGESKPAEPKGDSGRGNTPKSNEPKPSDSSAGNGRSNDGGNKSGDNKADADSNRGNANRGNDDKANGNQSNGNKSNDNKSNDNKSNDNKGNGGQQGGNNAKGGDGSNDADDGEDGEGGNRRRRRRGRGRDGNQQQEEFTGDPIPVAGHLDLRHDGYGFLRVQGYLPSRQDVYVSVKQTRQFGLRDGDHIDGTSRPVFRNEKNPALLRIDKVNGKDPELARDRPHFADLTPIFPVDRITLEQASIPTAITGRLLDMLAPIGKGQRGLILSPPKSGKTSIIAEIGKAIVANDPEIDVFVVALDERPEEVTELRRALPKAEIVASTFDRPADEHTRMVELVLARAERLAEDGHDVVLLVDGLTRLVRAYNIATQSSGKTLPGGLDLAALHPAKRFFGAARKLEEGGSLSIIATVAVETGSVLDASIAEEFAGTANMELKLDRHMATRRVHPAIDIGASSTRQEGQLIPVEQLEQVETLRRVLAELALAPDAGKSGRPLERLIDRLVASPTNEAFLNDIANEPSL